MREGRVGGNIVTLTYISAHLYIFLRSTLCEGPASPPPEEVAQKVSPWPCGPFSSNIYIGASWSSPLPCPAPPPPLVSLASSSGNTFTRAWLHAPGLAFPIKGHPKSRQITPSTAPRYLGGPFHPRFGWPGSFPPLPVVGQRWIGQYSNCLRGPKI